MGVLSMLRLVQHHLPPLPAGIFAPAHPEPQSVIEISGTTCSNTGLVCDLSVRTVSLFMWQYLNPQQLEFRPLRHTYRNGSNDIKGESEENTAGWRAHEGTMWQHVWKVLKDLIPWWRSGVRSEVKRDKHIVRINCPTDALIQLLAFKSIRPSLP